MINKKGLNIIGFLIGSNIYISLVSTALALTGFLLFKTTDLVSAILFVFFSTLSSYNLQRYFKWRKKTAHVFLQPYTPANDAHWILLILISSVCASVFLFQTSLNQISLLFFIGSLTASYLFIHPVSKKLTGIRYIPFLKTVVVAFCWTALFFILTSKNNHFECFIINWKYWLIVFVEIWQACILFDLRDIQADKHEIKTFANTMSLKWIFVLWTTLTVIILLLMISSNNYAIVLPAYLPIAYVQLNAIVKKTPELVFTFLVDGSLVLFAILNYFAFTNA